MAFLSHQHLLKGCHHHRCPFVSLFVPPFVEIRTLLETELSLLIFLGKHSVPFVSLFVPLFVEIRTLLKTELSLLIFLGKHSVPYKHYPRGGDKASGKQHSGSGPS